MDNEPGRFIFIRCHFEDDVLVAVFRDTKNQVYTAKAVNVEDLDFLGGFDTADAAVEDAVREVS